jgi:hypothetical protein
MSIPFCRKMWIQPPVTSKSSSPSLSSERNKKTGTPGRFRFLLLGLPVPNGNKRPIYNPNQRSRKNRGAMAIMASGWMAMVYVAINVAQTCEKYNHRRKRFL